MSCGKLTIAQALRQEMLRTGAKLAWVGEPDLLLEAYKLSGGRIEHPMSQVAAVLAAVRRSKLFVPAGFIRACDSAGRREILHPCFRLPRPPVAASAPAEIA